ncbi:MAG TPA: hypothetical protein DEE98_00190 [Elusimicrobia bacterium]|nr:MAG: hypothetical protein A2278_08735 [Elusimicrobia bacterium RIFOXYA12_FULL_49_49]OGS14787.1 MAG: hypothetical protein A2251_09860 [Elusimicrobia bacterium RIFOXYA2_FULL_47_53]OGS25563.1 MAG: hypothetical protein A2339_05735 [Elusimicrobia bacterium RIFOXYB12_FULL_50_12]OGS28929.1 MAG: hypothetical protein A2323_05165 [Elusimicrobia bacterium RIFOXYB2_FULL_46_23]HBU68784.1 hypothetical protein [Elusimicrobiota bacterium]
MAKLLFVTDNTKIFTAIRESFAKYGYFLDVAISADEAVSRIRAGKPDAVILGHSGVSKDVFSGMVKRSGINSLPIAEFSAEELAALDIKAMTDKISSALSKKKVLIAEDDRQMSQIFQSLLAASGFEVRAAFDGAETLSEIKSWKPNLVVLDIMLPVIDGFHICQMLNEDPSFEIRPKVLIISGRGSDWDQNLGAACGAEEYLVKPVNNAVFINKVKEITGR